MAGHVSHYLLVEGMHFLVKGIVLQDGSAIILLSLNQKYCFIVRTAISWKTDQFRLAKQYSCEHCCGARAGQLWRKSDPETTRLRIRLTCYFFTKKQLLLKQLSQIYLTIWVNTNSTHIFVKVSVLDVWQVLLFKLIFFLSVGEFFLHCGFHSVGGYNREVSIEQSINNNFKIYQTRYALILRNILICLYFSLCGLI